MTDIATNHAEPQTEAEREAARVAAEAASAEKYRAQATPPRGSTADVVEAGDGKPERPPHIPEKFWDAEKGEVRVEELAKSYAELEKLRNKPVEEKPLTEAEKEAAAANEKAQADFHALREATTQSIIETGAPTEDQYAAYEARGFSRQDVDAFIEGQKAIGMLRAQEVMNEVGGEETYKQLLEWGRSAYSEEEIKAFDHDIASEDKAVRLNAVRGLAARHAQANGRVGKSVTTAGTTAGAHTGYTDRSQMIRDMSDPKYKKDESFRQEVARKVQLARAAGVDLR